MHILLYQPEIPPNTGNIARLCAATHTPLHLIEPLGFKLEDRYLRRAGLDYWKHVTLKVWAQFNDYINTDGLGQRLVMTSARNGIAVNQFMFSVKDTLVFGRETAGLPKHIIEQSECRVRIPTYDTVRSLNLSTAAGIILYQALAITGILTTLG